jgi:hypothetical protein
VSIEAEAADVLGTGEVLVEPLAHGKTLTTTEHVDRVTRGDRSAVRKLISPERGERLPTHFRYWRREQLVYEQGVPAPYVEAGLRAPRLLGVYEEPTGEVALWLEDVGGTPGTSWQPHRYARAARLLGRAQGRLHLEPPPEPAHLSRDFLADYLTVWNRIPWRLLDSDEAWSQPLVAAHFPPGLRAAMGRLRREQDTFVNWVRTSPRTLSHLDFWASNLIDAEGGMVLLDWAFLGDGALGEDVGNLVPEAAFDLWLPAALLPEIDRLVFDGYVAGLREAGWADEARRLAAELG